MSRKVNEMMRERRAIEREIMEELDLASLAETRKAIAREVTYQRFNTQEHIDHYYNFLRKEVYSEGDGKPDNFIKAEAKEMANEHAWMFSFDWNQLDDYDSMSNSEIAQAFGLLRVA